MVIGLPGGDDVGALVQRTQGGSSPQFGLLFLSL